MELIEQIIDEAKASNVTLYIKAGRLAFIAEQGGFPSALRAKISEHKKGIISALLAAQGISLQTSTEPFALLTEGERAAVAGEYEDAYPMSALQAGMVFH